MALALRLALAVSGLALLVARPSLAGSACESASSRTREVFCSTPENRAEFGEMQALAAELAAAAPDFARDALVAEQERFVEIQTRSTATSGSPPAVERNAKRRMDERKALLEMRKATPVAVDPPEAPADAFADYCESLVHGRSPEADVVSFLEESLKTDDCRSSEKALPGFFVFDDSKSSFPKKLTRLGPVAYLVHLRELVLPYQTAVRDLGPLRKLTLLRRISVSAAPVETLEPLRNLKLLEDLEVRTTKVKDLNPIMDLPRLRSLDIRNLKVPERQVEEFEKKHPDCRVLN
jgi:hypothetical protein